MAVQPHAIRSAWTAEGQGPGPGPGPGSGLGSGSGSGFDAGSGTVADISTRAPSVRRRERRRRRGLQSDGDQDGDGDTSTCPVPEGYFQSLYTGLNMPCPEGTKCAGGEAKPAPVRGYWSKYDSATGEQAHQCHRKTCKGPGNQLDDERVLACYSGANYSSHKCVADELLCTEGAFGIMCGSCKIGYTYSSFSKKCVGCEKDWTVSPIPESVKALRGAAAPTVRPAASRRAVATSPPYRLAAPPPHHLAVSPLHHLASSQCRLATARTSPPHQSAVTRATRRTQRPFLLSVL